MKHKMLALILALTVVSWAQTATQTSPADPQPGTAPAEKTKCACCEKMASTDSKDAGMSCSRHAKHGKEMASCCTGKNAKSCCGDKDGKSCMKDDKTAASCCKNNCGKDKTASACCGGKSCKDGCCSKKTESAMSCCRHERHS